MKTIKYISIFIFCALFTGQVLAQDIETYKLQLPDIILEKGGPIHVSTLIDDTKEEISNNLSENFQKEMTKGIQAEGLAFKHNLPTFNPWMHTNLYNTTDNKDEATYVISGEYSFTTKHEKSYNEKSGVESADSLPFVYYEFYEKSTATVVGTVIITDIETDTEVARIPFSKELIDEDKKIMEHASSKDPMSLIPTLSDDFVHSFRYKFSAVKVPYEYNFPKIKPENKELKKEFREYKRNLKDLADEGKLNELHTMYLEIQQKEDSPEVNESLGMCYEIIGNYTKAKEYYDKCDNAQRNIGLVQQINIQNTLKDLGIAIVEPVF